MKCNLFSTYIDLLKVDLLPEHGVFWFFPNLNSKGNVGTLNDITPEASNQNVVTSFVSLISHRKKCLIEAEREKGEEVLTACPATKDPKVRLGTLFDARRVSNASPF